MGDYADFCEMYGGSPNDPDFMDRWFDEDNKKTKSIDRFISNREEEKFINEFDLSANEWQQVRRYVAIFIDHSLTKHHEVNEYITTRNLWGKFTEIRSMNDHGGGVVVHGITKKHFRLVCEVLKITGGNGAPLLHDQKY